MDSNRIGAIAEHAIAAELVQLGFDVLWPLVEGRYDLAIDLDGRLIRIQCKSAPMRGDVIVVRARTNRRAPEGFRHSTYSADEVDVIAAYAPTLKRCFAAPIQIFRREREPLPPPVHAAKWPASGTTLRRRLPPRGC